MFKKIYKSTLFLCFTFFSLYSMDFNFGGDYSLVSTYVWRGIKQYNGPALQSTFSVTYDNITFGLWSSSVDFGNGTEVETDPFVGYSKSFKDVAIDVGFTIYSYDFFETYNFDSKIEMEIYGSVGYNNFGLSLYYVPSQKSTKNDIQRSFYWIETDYESEIMELKVGVKLSYGTYSSRFLSVPTKESIGFIDISIGKEIGSGFSINWDFCKSIGKKTEDLFYFGIGYTF